MMMKILLVCHLLALGYAQLVVPDPSFEASVYSQDLEPHSRTKHEAETTTMPQLKIEQDEATTPAAETTTSPKAPEATSTTTTTTTTTKKPQPPQPQPPQPEPPQTQPPQPQPPQPQPPQQQPQPYPPFPPQHYLRPYPQLYPQQYPQPYPQAYPYPYPQPPQKPSPTEPEPVGKPTKESTDISPQSAFGNSPYSPYLPYPRTFNPYSPQPFASFGRVPGPQYQPIYPNMGMEGSKSNPKSDEQSGDDDMMPHHPKKPAEEDDNPFKPNYGYPPVYVVHRQPSIHSFPYGPPSPFSFRSY